jgi:metal-responsive CopG/Arc/MetJ family transcriptional regulator
MGAIDSSQATKGRRRMPAAARQATKPVKVAIDFPAPLFRETERAAHELSTNRSQLIRSAVEMFLRQRNRERLERAIAESFQANRDLDRQLVDEFRHVDVDAETGL